GPDVAALPLDGGGHHVVDEAVLVGDAGVLELGPELPVEHLLEDVLERAVVGLEDGVLGGQVHRVAVLQAVVERGAREVLDGFGEVVHPHHDAALLGHVDDLVLDGLRAVCGRVGDGDLAGSGDAEVGGPVLVAERVTADDDRLGPARDVPRHVRDDDRGTEDRPAQDVADGAVGRAVHPREPELLHARLVGGDGGALDAPPCFLIAWAASTVTRSSVASRFSRPRSYSSTDTSRYGWMSLSMMNCQMMRVISSQSSSTTVPSSLIFGVGLASCARPRQGPRPSVGTCCVPHLTGVGGTREWRSAT